VQQPTCRQPLGFHRRLQTPVCFSLAVLASSNISVSRSGSAKSKARCSPLSEIAICFLLRWGNIAKITANLNPAPPLEHVKAGPQTAEGVVTDTRLPLVVWEGFFHPLPQSIVDLPDNDDTLGDVLSAAWLQMAFVILKPRIANLSLCCTRAESCFHFRECYQSTWLCRHLL
jgi:hypothetical protein